MGRFIAKGAEPSVAGSVVVPFQRLKDVARHPWQLLQWRHRHILFVADLDGVQNPAMTVWLYLAVSAGRGQAHDRSGRQRVIGLAAGLRAGLGWLRDLQGADRWRRFAERSIALPPPVTAPSSCRRAVFLRGDFARGVTIGGSIGHIAGVINHLPREAGMPVLVTGETVPTVAPAIPQVRVVPPRRFWDLPDALAIAYSLPLAAAVIAAARTAPGAGFLYQRTSRSCIGGMIAARCCQLPLVSEYNGSEVWVETHWGGRRSSWSTLAERIELANLKADRKSVV